MYLSEVDSGGCAWICSEKDCTHFEPESPAEPCAERDMKRKPVAVSAFQPRLKSRSGDKRFAS